MQNTVDKSVPDKRAWILYGPPASGKSTGAANLVFYCGYTEINRDNIRFNEVMPGGDWTCWKWGLEKQVTQIWNRKLEEAMADGVNIVISDTNMDRNKREGLVKRLEANGYEVNLNLYTLPLEELIARDAKRGKMSVGADIVEKFWRMQENEQHFD